MSLKVPHIRILSLLLAIGWTMGTLVSALGVILSVKIDTPTGATIVVTFGGVLVLMFLLHLILHHGRHAPALEGATSSQHEV
jgi:ABC-type Mn2+/Zn2+ transport system permease subunit